MGTFAFANGAWRSIELWFMPEVWWSGGSPWITPMPVFHEQLFISELKAFGIPTGPYNLSVSDGTLKGVHERLGALFRHTPLTALFVEEGIVDPVG
jgi:hypothetical protein